MKRGSYTNTHKCESNKIGWGLSRPNPPTPTNRAVETIYNLCLVESTVVPVIVFGCTDEHLATILMHNLELPEVWTVWQ
jgi:hypothetical protein